LDGVLSEAVWRSTPAVTSWYQQAPREGASPSQTTKMWVIYGDEAIYVAARLSETDPSSVTARTLERDSFSGSDETPKQDAVAVVLDSFNDDRTGLAFVVTPAGVRTDMEIAKDGKAQNIEWNAFWDAATTRDKSGWVAEMRIPFSSLRFREGAEGYVEMGMILWRYRAENIEYDIYPAIPNRWDASAYKPSEAAPVRFKGVVSKRPYYVRPYMLGGMKRERTVDEEQVVSDFAREWTREVGLDVKHALTSDLILDVTINTDFAQVEADDQRINLSRFSLFFPEKRDFFQERADLFTFRFPGGPQRIFQSRRIGIYDGEPVPILGGARLTGRIGSWEVGAIEMQTAQTEVGDISVPSENFGVARVKRPVIGGGSYVGGMLTSRVDFNGDYNLVYATDADLRLYDDYYLGLQLGQSATPETRAAKSVVATAVLQRRVQRGFSFGSSFAHLGTSFYPAVGFLRRQGYHRWGHRTQYTWFPKSASIIQNHSLIHRFEFIWGSRFRLLETSTSSLTWSALFRSGTRAQLRVEYAQEQLEKPFLVGDEVPVAPGTYRFWSGQVEAATPVGAPLRFEVQGEGGQYFNGRQFGGELSSLWTPSPHFALELDYNYNRVALTQGTFNAHVARVRLEGALNKAFSANAYVQYNSSTEQFAPNLRFRYNPSEGHNLYLVYREDINVGQSTLRAPERPWTRARSMLVKYTYTFVL